MKGQTPAPAPATRQATGRNTRAHRTPVSVEYATAVAAPPVAPGDKHAPDRHSRQKPDSLSAVRPTLLHRQVAEAAYFKAMARGFEPGRELDDWLQAEREFGSSAGSSAD